MLLFVFLFLTADDAAKAASEPASIPAIKATVPKPVPVAELDQLKYFEGSWSCDGQAAASAFGHEHKFKATLKVKADLDKFWYAVAYEEKKSKDHPLPFSAHGFWSFDATNKRFFRLFADAYGSSDNGTSAGWDGDNWVWAGELANYLGRAKLNFRQTLSKKSNREFSEHFEFDNDGQWTGPVTTVCKKQ